MSSEKRYVIVGNGVAAAGCIEGIRSIDAQSPITVVSEERHAVYCRPLISYLLEGKTDEHKMNYRPESFYTDNGCEVLYGRGAVSIDGAKKTVTLDNGDVLHYTSLCAATGSSPFVPPFEGRDTVEKKFSFMTLDDAQALRAAVDKKSRVLIIGAGLIGLKCAEGLHGLVGSITVCDLADRVLSSILDDECAALIQKRLEDNGISFMLGDSAQRFEGNTAVMKSGAKVGFDALVLAVGVRANTAIFKDAGCETGRGIAVNELMETTVPGIYAAGDCTEGTDISCGERRVLAIMPNAYMQGYAAGVNMAGGERRFDNAIPMNSIGFFGMHAMTAGSYTGEMSEQKTANSIKRLFTGDDLLKGFMIIGEDIERAGIYTSMIRERVPLDTVDMELLKKTASSVIYSQDVRKNRFGGVV